MVRSMVQAMPALAGFGPTISTAGAAGFSAQSLQQDVTIHAEFPNVTNREEIKAAFADLNNRAIQYANRKG